MGYKSHVRKPKLLSARVGLFESRKCYDSKGKGMKE
jgi:hypothetical protein